jgi:hypothetical protein
MNIYNDKRVKIILACCLQVSKAALLAGFKIPRKRVIDEINSQPCSSQQADARDAALRAENFPMTTPGAAAGNPIGPELIKRARTMRFEGRFDKGKKKKKKKPRYANLNNIEVCSFI